MNLSLLFSVSRAIGEVHKITVAGLMLWNIGRMIAREHRRQPRYQAPGSRAHNGSGRRYLQ